MRLNEKIQAAQKRVGTSKKRAAWYRGHANANWALTPRLLRRQRTYASLVRCENQAFSEFRASARRYLPTELLTDSWDYLAAMQHFGVATRLLDWTTELNVAIYFAVANIEKLHIDKPEQWPCIWVLNPYHLNSIFANDNVVFDRADLIPYDYYNQTIDGIRSEKPWPHDNPIAINTGFANARIEAQHGRFTVHGQNLHPLGECNPGEPFHGLEKVLIDPNDWGELRRSDIRQPAFHLRVYPDIAGFARFLNHLNNV